MMIKPAEKIFCRSNQLNKKLPTFSPLIRSDVRLRCLPLVQAMKLLIVFVGRYISWMFFKANSLLNVSIKDTGYLVVTVLFGGLQIHLTLA